MELFNKRNFICDCGTTRIPETTPCTLRVNPQTGQKGAVISEEPANSNRYNHNFQNKFCGCGQDYDAHAEKGTMFQCLGLGACEDGGCGEDWWHPECLVGLSRVEYANMVENTKQSKIAIATDDAPAAQTAKSDRTSSAIESRPLDTRATATSLTMMSTIVDENDMIVEPGKTRDDDDPPLPPGFPLEDDFDQFICYKCVEANPWIKRYAGSAGFLEPVYHDKATVITKANPFYDLASEVADVTSKKRKKSGTDDEDENIQEDTPAALKAPLPAKRQKSEDPTSALPSTSQDAVTLHVTPKKRETGTDVKHLVLPPLSGLALTTPFSLFLRSDFRDHLCRCSECFPYLKAYPQLLEEEETYEPPVSEDDREGAQSVGTGSLLDRGEAAFNNMDRIRAIQGAMAYAHLKDKISAFLKPFAESGQVVGAEDVKAYFEKLRGDEQGIKSAASGAKANGSDGDGGGSDDDKRSDGDHRREQSGY